jgi:hypothetical protein
MFAAPVCDMPAIGISDMTEQHVGHIDIFFRRIIMQVFTMSPKRNIHKENCQYDLQPPHNSTHAIILLKAISTNPDLISRFSSTPPLINRIRPSSREEISGA